MTDYDFTHVDVPLERGEGVDAYSASRCRALVAAVMLLTLRDLYPSRYRGTVDEMHEAEEWFEYEGTEPFSIRWCCSMLDIDYEIVMVGYRFNRAEFAKAACTAIQYVGPRLEKHTEVLRLPKMPAWRVRANADKLKRGMEAALGK